MTDVPQRRNTAPLWALLIATLLIVLVVVFIKPDGEQAVVRMEGTGEPDTAGVSLAQDRARETYENQDAAPTAN